MSKRYSSPEAERAVKAAFKRDPALAAAFAEIDKMGQGDNRKGSRMANPQPQGPRVISVRADPKLIREEPIPQPISEKPDPQILIQPASTPLARPKTRSLISSPEKLVQAPPPSDTAPTVHYPTPSQPPAAAPAYPKEPDPELLELVRLYQRMSERDRREMLWLARFKVELNK